MLFSDSYPTNAFAREGATADQNTDWVYELIGEDWKVCAVIHLHPCPSVDMGM